MGKKTLVVVGAGKGMGNNIAEVYGKKGFRVVLMARKQASLDAYAILQSIREAYHLLK